MRLGGPRRPADQEGPGVPVNPEKRRNFLQPEFPSFVFQGCECGRILFWRVRRPGPRLSDSSPDGTRVPPLGPAVPDGGGGNQARRDADGITASDWTPRGDAARAGWNGDAAAFTMRSSCVARCASCVVRRVACGVRRVLASCGMQHVACDVQPAACSVRRAACGVQRVLASCGMQHVACGVQHAACGVRRAACSVWRAALGVVQHAACVVQCSVCGVWHAYASCTDAWRCPSERQNQPVTAGIQSTTIENPSSRARQCKDIHTYTAVVGGKICL